MPVHDAIPLEEARRAAQAAGLLLEQRPAGLTLCGDGMELAGDFGALLPRLRQDRLARELLVRAARVKGAPQPLRAEWGREPATI